MESEEESGKFLYGRALEVDGDTRRPSLLAGDPVDVGNQYPSKKIAGEIETLQQ